MRTLTSTLFILLFFNAFTQNRIINPWTEQIIVVSDSADISGYQALSDTLIKQLLAMELLDSNSVDSSRIWKLSHVVFSGWEEVVGHDPDSYYNVGIVKDGYLFVKEKVIIDSFSPLFAEKDKFPLHSIAIYISRNDPMNCKYIAYLSESIFVIRYIHSYPNGNMTSFYHEEVYYFVR